jgi:hypothetical protein
MKTLLMTGSLFFAFLLGGCASSDADSAGLHGTPPDPVTEMTRGACCRIPSN